MIFNSKIYTTREQSERLLALGLKKETADMKYPCTREYYGGVLTEGTSSLPIIIDTEDDDITEYDIPAWSLDRLRELIPENIFTGVGNQWHRVMYNGILTYEDGDDSLVIFREENIYDRCISCIEWLIKEGYFNKEYLV